MRLLSLSLCSLCLYPYNTFVLFCSLSLLYLYNGCIIRAYTIYTDQHLINNAHALSYPPVYSQTWPQREGKKVQFPIRVGAVLDWSIALFGLDGWPSRAVLVFGWLVFKTQNIVGSSKSWWLAGQWIYILMCIKRRPGWRWQSRGDDSKAVASSIWREPISPHPRSAKASSSLLVY